MNKICIEFATLETCSTARGVVIAIDVMRAFTTAAYGFVAGARQILLVSTVEQALALRERFPGALVMGESGGQPVAGFDLWNSPGQFSGLDMANRTLIQRTSAGTQGVVRSSAASYLFAASFVVAGATVSAVQRLQPTQVTFVLTGVRPDEPGSGLEDVACAKYMAALLRDQKPDPTRYLAWVTDYISGRLHEASEDLINRFKVDLELCSQVDRFTFSMPVKRQDDLLIMEKSIHVPD